MKPRVATIPRGRDGHASRPLGWFPRHSCFCSPMLAVNPGLSGLTVRAAYQESRASILFEVLPSALCRPAGNGRINGLGSAPLVASLWTSAREWTSRTLEMEAAEVGAAIRCLVVGDSPRGTETAESLTIVKRSSFATRVSFESVARIPGELVTTPSHGSEEKTRRVRPFIPVSTSSPSPSWTSSPSRCVGRPD